MKKDNRGFTLIELIVVILIIGILILLATPKFFKYIDKAKETHIVHDIKVAENLSMVYYIKNNEYKLQTGIPVDKEFLKSNLDKENIYGTIGKIDEIDGEESGNYYLLDEQYLKNEIKTRLKGKFIINNDGRVLYLNNLEESIEDEFINYRYVEKYNITRDDGSDHIISEIKNRKILAKGNRKVELEEVYKDEETDLIYILLEPQGSKIVNYENELIEVKYIEFKYSSIEPNPLVKVIAPVIIRYIDRDTNEEIKRGYIEKIIGESQDIKASEFEGFDGKLYRHDNFTVDITDEYFQFDRNIDRKILYVDVVSTRIK